MKQIAYKRQEMFCEEKQVFQFTYSYFKITVFIVIYLILI